MNVASAAETLIARVLAERNGPACVTCSFQTECMALVHMVTRQRPDIPVLFLDTGYHFAETYEYRDRMSSLLNLNLINLRPRITVAEQEGQFGILYQSAPDRCCGIRKVEPLFTGLDRYDVWFTGLRRDQSPTRANLREADDFRLPSGKTLYKVSPLVDWTGRDTWSYLKEHNIPVLPLYEHGYTSIGCEPCTSLPVDPDNPRSGRWAGRKLECGIHISGQ
jgi:phosphoadenosine phosphosulfate reductase